VLHFFVRDGVLIISRFAYYAFMLAILTLRARQGRLLAPPTSLFCGCARQGRYLKNLLMMLVVSVVRIDLLISVRIVLISENWLD
jgi:hypothetical protein